MIVKIEGPIQTFAKWKAMVQSNTAKVKNIINKPGASLNNIFEGNPMFSHLM